MHENHESAKVCILGPSSSCEYHLGIEVLEEKLLTILGDGHSWLKEGNSFFRIVLARFCGVPEQDVRTPHGPCPAVTLSPTRLRRSPADVLWAGSFWSKANSVSFSFSIFSGLLCNILDVETIGRTPQNLQSDDYLVVRYGSVQSPSFEVFRKNNVLKHRSKGADALLVRPDRI